VFIIKYLEVLYLLWKDIFSRICEYSYRIPLPPLLLRRSPGTPPPPQAPFKTAKTALLFLLTNNVLVYCKDFWRWQKCKRGLMKGEL
jgi:hypothetical protein